MKKPKDEKLADELFDAVVGELRKMVFRQNVVDGSIGMSSLILDMSNWMWKSKKNFLLTRKGDTYMSFAKTVDVKHWNDRLPERLKSMVDVMLESSTLEEMKIKFAVAGLLGEKPRDERA